MTKAPNQTVTRAQLDALEAGRAKPRETLDYTIGGTTEKAIHEQTELERNHALRTGHDRLRQASQSIQTAHVFSAQEGYAKAQFNQAQKSYADRQREAAQSARQKPHSRDR